MLTKRSESTAERIRLAFEEGCSVAEVCEWFGVSREAAWVALRGPVASTGADCLRELADER